MPTYEYRCKACGHHFEKVHAPTEKVSKTCPRCKKRQVERQIGTGLALIFKGSGFYQTDYRSESYLKAAKKEKESSKATDKKSPDKTAAKKGKASPTKKEKARKDQGAAPKRAAPGKDS